MSKVITGEVRFSYLNWAQPKKNDLNGKMEYSTQILVPKKDAATVTKLKEAIKAAAKKKFGDKLPPGLKSPLRDGDTETKEDGSPLSAEYKGHYWINIKSDQKPGIVDSTKQPILDPAEFVSGDYGFVSINAYGYDQKGNKGVSFGWNNAMMSRRGEPLGNRSRAEDDFADIEVAEGGAATGSDDGFLD